MTKSRLLVAAAILIALTIGLFLLDRLTSLDRAYPIPPSEYRKEIAKVTPGMTEEELDRVIHGYTTKVKSRSGMRYMMEPRDDVITLLPRLKYAIIVEFDERGRAVKAEWADL